jgi:hypothetical protein
MNIEVRPVGGRKKFYLAQAHLGMTPMIQRWTFI